MTFIGVVPGAFVEISPFSSVLLCFLVTLLFLWLELVFERLFFRAVFGILPFVLVLKFLLDFNNISIGRTE